MSPSGLQPIPLGIAVQLDRLDAAGVAFARQGGAVQQPPEDVDPQQLLALLMPASPLAE